ncbi:MAG: hypothetical protein LBK82_16805 [Planctomycetaceae bacterium]|jgi:hypothetical protein|nr:hypothetical protein [Planctomycetaceae bacterium]
MKKTIVVLCIVSFLFLCCGQFLATAAAESVSKNVTSCMLKGEPREKVAERTFSEALETPVSFVSNAEIKLRLVLLMFAQHCRVPIFCNEKTSEKLETPVKINVDKPIPFKEFLEPILKQQGLIYTVTDNAVHITSVSNETSKIVEKIEQSAHSEQQTTNPIAEQLKIPFSCNIKKPVTLMDALKQISKTTEISMIIDHGRIWESGTKSEMEMEKPFNFYFPFKIPLSNVLDYLTKQQNLAWIVQNDHILITSKRYAERNKNADDTRMYYIGDLLEDTPQLLSEKEPHTIPISNDTFLPLIDYITTMIESETWDGNITTYYPNKSLVIRQPNNVHEQIAKLLKTLRQFNDCSDNEIKSSQWESPPIPSETVYYYQQYDVSDLTIPTEENTNGLIDLIQCVVSPDDWKKRGDGPGFINIQENQLFVLQEHRIHTEIADILEQLRQLNKSPVKNKTLKISGR